MAQQTPRIFRPTRFVIEGIGFEPEHRFEGYTDDTTWNGWDVPYFTFEVADKVAGWFRTRFGCDFAYDKARDAFVYKPCNHKTPNGNDCENQPWEEESVYDAVPMTITPNGATMPLYSIGGMEWTWDEWLPEWEAQYNAEQAAKA